jgi:hypothetical protein
MRLSLNGNYAPWVQPEYGYDAEGNKVEPQPGFRLLKEGEEIIADDIPFDVYAGWLIGYGKYQAKNGHCALSIGRWTTWQRKKDKVND